MMKTQTHTRKMAGRQRLSLARGSTGRGAPPAPGGGKGPPSEPTEGARPGRHPDFRPRAPSRERASFCCFEPSGLCFSTTAALKRLPCAHCVGQ